MDASSLCHDCGLIFTEKWMLKEHKRVAHDERVLKCDHCQIEVVGFPFIEYLQCIKEVHNMCIAEVFDDNSEILINEFKCKFDKLYTDFKLPMTLKIHVIVDHYSDYFKEIGKFFRKTNGEHHEAIHHTIKVFETKKKLYMKKHLGSLIHQAKCLQSISTFNVLRAGYTTPNTMRIRRRRCSSTSSSPSSPASSPRKIYPKNMKKSFVNRFILDNIGE